MKMKRLLIVLTAGATLLTACQESSQMSNRIAVALHANYIHPDRQKLECDSNGTTLVFTVNSQDTPWQITGMPEWIQISPTSGSGTSTVQVTIPAYWWAAARTGIFTLSSSSPDWSYSVPITVTQSGATAFADLSEDSFVFDGGGGEGVVTVESNCEWTLSTQDGWIDVNRVDDGRFTFSLDENPSFDAREGTIRVMYNSQVVSTVRVSQRAAKVDVVTSQLNYGNVAGDYTLQITSEAAWRARTSSDWIELSGSTATAGTNKLRISVTPNLYQEDRNGFVYLEFSASGNQIAEIPVHQEGVQLLLGDAEGANIELTSSLEHDYAIKVTSNTDWYVSNVPYFMTAEPMSGTGNAVISLHVKNNGSFSWRGWDQFSVNRQNSWVQSSVYFAQVGKTLNMDRTYLEFRDVASTQYVEVTTDGTWELAYDTNSFYSATPGASQGNGRIAVSVEDNRNPWTRDGYIEFRLLGMTDYEYGYYPQSINIWQTNWEERWQNTATDLEMPAMGGSYNLYIDTNDNWSLSFTEPGDWFHFTGETSGAGSGWVSFDIDVNNSINARGVKVLVTFGHDLDPVEITIRQPGRAMSLNCEGIFFFAKGGSNTVTVWADGRYQLETVSGDWFTVTEGEGNVFTVTVPENTTDGIREGAVRLTLLDLAEGSLVIDLPVVQTTKEIGFTRGGFEQDVNLDIGKGSGMVISVVSYSGDEDWNKQYSASIKVTGFENDSDWNGGSAGAAIGGEGFDDDENWN